MGLVIESALGHTFLSTDEEGQDACLTCGGEWRLVPGYREGIEKYATSNGDDADHCSGNTSLVHGIERVCQAGDGSGCEASQDGQCEHTNHGCNCILCSG